MNRAIRGYDRRLRSASFLLVVGLALVPAFLAFGLAGPLWSVTMATALIFVGLLRTPRSPLIPGTLEINRSFAPGLFTLVESLAERAGLGQVPELRIVPGGHANAAATLRGNTPVLVVTETLLSRLDTRRLSAVLAHEIAHLVHQDLVVFRLAATLQAGTFVLGTLTASVALLTVPFNGYESAFWTALALGSPPAARLLFASLSRTREFAADLESAKLTGDPGALAQALLDIEYRPKTVWDWILGTRTPLPTDAPTDAFRTHPPTPERIRRLTLLALGAS